MWDGVDNFGESEVIGLHPWLSVLNFLLMVFGVGMDDNSMLNAIFIWGSDSFCVAEGGNDRRSGKWAIDVFP